MSDVTDRIGELLSKLQSTDFYEREEAVRELATYDKDEAVAGLVLALEDPDLGIREIAAEQLAQMKGATAAQLLIRFLGHADIGTRNLAAEILVRIGEPAVDPLMANLDADDSDIRKFIVDVLGLIGDTKAVDVLCERLYDSNPNVVCSAAEALGEIGSATCVPALLEVYTRVEDVRLSAVEALGKIGDLSTLEYLYGCMDSDEPLIAYAAMEAVGNIGASESAERLARHLNDQDITLAQAALSAIINISDRHGGKIDQDLPLDRFTDYLFERILGHDKKITQFTLNRLSRWYSNDVIRSLLGVLDALEDDELAHATNILLQAGPSICPVLLEEIGEVSLKSRLLYLDILGANVDEDVVRQLARLARDEEPEVRQKLALILGRSGESSAVPILRRLSQDDIGHVRASAFTALGWLSSEQEADVLFQGLDDIYPDVREAAMGALILVGGPQVVAKFTADLYHPDAERQRLAVTALGMIGEPDVVQPLLKAVNHPEPALRRSAIETIGRIGDADDLAPVSIALSDEDAGVRKAAVTTLLAIRGEAAVDEVKFLLDDPDVWVRYHTIAAIGELGNVEHSRYILPYLADEQDIIRIAAIRALARMDCHEAVKTIKTLMTDRNRDLVEAAQQAVSQLEGVR